jgi:hypothetical protein
MKPTDFSPGACQSADCSKLPPGPHRPPPAQRMPTADLIDFGKKPELRASTHSRLSESSRRAIQRAVVFLGLATFGMLVWAFIAARVPAPAPVVSTQSERPTLDASQMWWADKTQQLGGTFDLSPDFELPTDFMRPSEKKSVPPSLPPAGHEQPK